RSHLEKGFKAAREGRSEEALSQLEAAEAITGQLLVQGAEVKSTNAPMLGFRKEMGDLMQAREHRLGRLRQSIDSLKTEGKYKAALKEAKELRKHAKGVELSELQAEMEELATVEVRERAKKLLDQEQRTGGVPITGTDRRFTDLSSPGRPAAKPMPPALAKLGVVAGRPRRGDKKLKVRMRLSMPARIEPVEAKKKSPVDVRAFGIPWNDRMKYPRDRKEQAKIREPYGGIGNTSLRRAVPWNSAGALCRSENPAVSDTPRTNGGGIPEKSPG
ncbi:hypothetical protein LCGC14_2982640, partial [marine sediment metagenome]